MLHLACLLEIQLVLLRGRRVVDVFGFGAFRLRPELYKFRRECRREIFVVLLKTVEDGVEVEREGQFVLRVLALVAERDRVEPLHDSVGAREYHRGEEVIKVARSVAGAVFDARLVLLDITRDAHGGRARALSEGRGDRSLVSVHEAAVAVRARAGEGEKASRKAVAQRTGGIGEPFLGEIEKHVAREDRFAIFF